MADLFYDCGAYGLFTLEAEKWQPTYRGKLSDPVKFKPNPTAPTNDRIWKELGGIIEALGGDIHIIDVGGYIGTFTIPLAIEAARHGFHPTFDVFEPGPTRHVLSRNIELNGLAGQVRLHDAAISELPGFITYRWRDDGAIGGHVMSVGDTTQTRMVNATTIDDIVSHRNEPLFIKLDTQGYEPHIMKSASKVIAKKQAVWRIEFIKWSANSKFHDGMSFAQYLLSEFHCFEDEREIDADAMPAFLDEIDKRPARMADLVLIPKNTPLTERLVAAVEG